MARFVPIVIEVKNADRGAAEVGKVNNAFKKLDREVNDLSQKGALSNPFKNFSPAADSASKSASNLRNSLRDTWLTLGAASVTLSPLIDGVWGLGRSLFSLTQETAASVLAQDRLSKQTGFTQTTISALTNATELADVQTSILNTSLVAFDKNLQAVREGNKGLGVAFKSLNIDIASNETALRSAFKALDALPEGYTKTAAAQRLFGESGRDILLIIDETNGDIDRAIRQYRDLATLVGGPTVEETRNFHREMTLADQQIKQVKITIARELMPEFSRMARSFSTWLRENRGEWQSWGRGVAAGIQLVIALVPQMRGLATVVEFLGRLAGRGGNTTQNPSWVRTYGLVTNSAADRWQSAILPREIDLGLTTDRDNSAAQRRAERDRQIIGAMREVADDLSFAFQEEFGKALQFRFGQTPLHSKLNYDHRAAFDIPLDPRTSEGQFVMDYLRDRGITFRASLGREVSQTTGKLISTGPHIHAGSLSGAIGRGLIASEGLLTSAGLQRAIDAQELVFAPWSGRMVTEAEYNKQRAAYAQRQREQALLPHDGDDFPQVQLPVQLERQWESYYKTVSERENELRNRRRDFAAEHGATQRDMIAEIGHLELDLDHLRQQNADDQFTEQRRLLGVRREELDVERQIQAVQDEIATGPYNQSLRIQLALLEDIADIRRRDEEAIIDQNRAQLELADAEIFHAEQARSIVLRHLADSRSQTEVFAHAIVDAYDAVNDVVLRGVQKITGGIRVLDQLLAGLITRLTNRLFQKLLDFIIPPGSGGGSRVNVGIPGASGGGIAGGFFNALNAFTGGGFQRAGGGNAGSGFSFGNFLSPFSSSLTAPTSLSAATAQQTSLASIQAGVGASVAAGLTSAAAAARPTGFLAQLGPSLGALAPILGLGLGSQLGGQSRFGQVLGGAGGLLGGGLAATFLAPKLFAAGGAFGSLGPGIAAFLTNPFTIAAAGALLVGAYFLSRNARRRQEEKIRNEISHDTGTAIWQLIDDARNLGLGQSLARWNEIQSQYFSRIAQIKDSKTRRNAELQWQNDFLPLKKYVEQRAKEGDQARLVEKRLVPEFSGGLTRGLVPYMGHPMTLIKVRPTERIDDVGLMKSWVVPGVDRGVDSVLTLATPKSRVLTRQQQAKIPGFANGTPEAMYGGGPIELTVNLSAELVVGKDKASEIVVTGAQSSDGRKVIVKVNRSARLNREF